MRGAVRSRQASTHALGVDAVRDASNECFALREHKRPVTGQQFPRQIEHEFDAGCCGGVPCIRGLRSLVLRHHETHAHVRTPTGG